MGIRDRNKNISPVAKIWAADENVDNSEHGQKNTKIREECFSKREKHTTKLQMTPACVVLKCRNNVFLYKFNLIVWFILQYYIWLGGKVIISSFIFVIQ